MLIRFNIENYLSFRDKVTFSMIAGRSGRDKASHVYSASARKAVPVLKSAVVYGANASGKSNLIKGIEAAQKQILLGTPPGQKIHHQPFKLDPAYGKRPTRFEFEILVQDKMFAYGFSCDADRIHDEWLYETDTKSDRLVFERTNTLEFNLEPLNKLNPNKKHRQFLEFTAAGTAENQLFLTEIRTRRVRENVADISPLLAVLGWFEHTLTVIKPDSKVEGVEYLLHSNARLADAFNVFLRHFDTGIASVKIEDIDPQTVDLPAEIRSNINEKLRKHSQESYFAVIENMTDKMRYVFIGEAGNVVVKKMMTVHESIASGANPIYFDLNEESDGTRRIMDLIPMLFSLMHDDKVFLVDELERSLHANLVFELMKLFHRHAEGKQNQLIVTSHETALLTQELLRRDEIWFVEKDRSGSSALFSLEEYDIRFDKKIRKDYLMGRFDAIPRFGNPDIITQMLPMN